MVLDLLLDVLFYSCVYADVHLMKNGMSVVSQRSKWS